MGAIWRVPPKSIREGKLLLDQQCWCWGQDIRHPEGNLLLKHGFVRERHESDKALSRYRIAVSLPPLVPRAPLPIMGEGKTNPLTPSLPLSGGEGAGGREGILWAFGLFYDGLWLLRQDFKIRLATSELPPDIWTVRDAPIHYPATEEEGERLREKLRAACLWIAEYEDKTPRAWRAETLRCWDKKSIPAGEQARRWRNLEESLQ